MGDIRNDMQLKLVMGMMVTEVIENIGDDIREYLQKNIEKYTYLDGTVYERTGEFIESFNWRKIEKSIYGVLREFEYMPVQTYLPEKWKHGSVFGGDARANLADILNVEGLTSKHWIAREVKPYWDITIKGLFDGGKINKLIDKQMKSVSRKYGFKAIRKI